MLGQKSDTDQGAIAASEAIQLFGERSPCGCGGSSGGNTASPVRVGSARRRRHNVAGEQRLLLGSGTERCLDEAERHAVGGRRRPPDPGARTGVRDTEQGAFAASLAAQFGASNDASPVRVYSPGGGGSVNQSNTAGSSALAGNGAETSQDGRQTIAGSPCGCGSLPIQVAGQSARTLQAAFGFSAALQAHPSNTSSPTRVYSGGGGGSVWQGNAALSSGDCAQPGPDTSGGAAGRMN